MKKICIFAGTTEGRRLAEALHASYDLTVCVATEYGEVLLDGIDGIRIHTGRMDSEQMTAFFGENNFELIIDATHPYAVLVTENIRAAAAETSIEYMRILRDCGETDGAVYVDSVASARDYLNTVDGNILLTTGSKELHEYVGLDMSRVWARVLPLASSLEACGEAGIMPSHIIAAQGPFSKELNIAELREIDAKWLVTKASGKNGGFDEKLSAAEAVGAKAIVIGAPKQVVGILLEAALDELLPERTIMTENTGTAEDSGMNECHDTAENLVTIVGIGPGDTRLLTDDAREAICNADAARYAVSMIVGRDTKVLEQNGICRAAVETVAENASDGVVAPLCFMLMFDPVGGFFYKSINTMDSMLGYKNDKYLYFGRVAAKTDDFVNFIPARVSALAMIIVSPVCGLDIKGAWRIFRRDRMKHASPNSAQTDSVCAGALGLRLAGDAVYGGVVHKKEHIGDPIREIEPRDITRANRLMYVSSALVLIVILAVRTAVSPCI